MNAESLLRILRESVLADAEGQSRVTVAYSGGLDSSIIAEIAMEYATVECVTCAVEGSYDAENAKRLAKEDGMRARIILIDSDTIEKKVGIASQVLGAANPVPIAYTIPIMTAVDESTERTVFAGNGADELFGGYSKYVSSSDPVSAMHSDIDKMLREARLLVAWAIGVGKLVRFPYAREEIQAFAKEIPLDSKINGTQRKIILKEVAGLLGLKSSERPKKAAQYSSGILRLMEKAAKQEHLALNEWTSRMAALHGRSPYERAEDVPHR